jgi:hypothetical protein
VNGYDRLVGTVLAKLLLLVAVVLMPLGMGPAAAATAAHEMRHAAMPMGHCPESGSNHHDKGGIAECTMACAGALPAVDFAHHEPLMIARQLMQPVAALQLDGLHPETAVPPPKLF